MTISAHNAWAWGGAKDGVKSLESCLKMLIQGAGGNGNILLNVGPRPDGLIDPEQVARLKEIGAWLEKNGESIYGTRGGPFKPGLSYVSTRKGNAIYVHIMKWPGDVLVLPALPAKIVRCSALTGGTVKAEQVDGELRIQVAVADRQPIDTIVKLDLDGPATDMAPLEPLTGEVPSLPERKSRHNNRKK